MNEINYIIVKLMNNSNIVEIPEIWLKQNYNKLIVGAFYYCE